MNPELKLQIREALTRVISLPRCNPHVFELATNYLVTGAVVGANFTQVMYTDSVFATAFWLMTWVKMDHERMVQNHVEELNRLIKHYETLQSQNCSPY